MVFLYKKKSTAQKFRKKGFKVVRLETPAGVRFTTSKVMRRK